VFHSDRRQCLEARWTGWTTRWTLVVVRRSVECMEDGGCTASQSQISVLSPLSVSIFRSEPQHFFFFFLGFGWYFWQRISEKNLRELENWKAIWFAPFSLVECEFFFYWHFSDYTFAVWIGFDCCLMSNYFFSLGPICCVLRSCDFYFFFSLFLVWFVVVVGFFFNYYYYDFFFF
jgi:hypothetical protein